MNTDSKSDKSTPEQVAVWMHSELQRDHVLHQDEAASAIADRFGDEFVHYNTQGNPAIDPAVLAAFRGLTEDSVVWVKGERLWRWREEGDEPGRRQP